MRDIAQVVIQTAAHQNGNGQARLDAVLLCTLLAAGGSLADGEDLRDGEADGGCDVQAQRRAFLIRLDMLEPGTIMLKWVGIFLLIGLALELLRWKLAAAIAFGFSGALCATRVCRFSEEKLGQMLSVESQAMMLLVKSKAEDAS